LIDAENFRIYEFSDYQRIWSTFPDAVHKAGFVWRERHQAMKFLRMYCYPDFFKDEHFSP